MTQVEQELGVAVHACDPSIWEVEAGESDVQLSVCQASLMT